jgi:hypothetical protein
MSGNEHGFSSKCDYPQCAAVRLAGPAADWRVVLIGSRYLDICPLHQDVTPEHMRVLDELRAAK